MSDSLAGLRPVALDDYGQWAAYHEYQADHLVRSMREPQDEGERLGQLMGELDHRAEAIGYRELQHQREMKELQQHSAATFSAHVVTYGPLVNNLAQLQTLAHEDQSRLRLLANNVGYIEELRQPFSTLSQEDAELAFRRGANAAINEQYREQKEAHGFSRLHSGALSPDSVESYQAGRQFAANPSQGIGTGRPPHSLVLESFAQGVEDHRKERNSVPQEITFAPEEYARTGRASQNGSSDPVAQAVVQERILESRQEQLSTEWKEATASNPVERNAALNYYRGQADAYNGIREDLIRSHPELATELPRAINVDEIQVRLQAVEQDQRQDRSLAVAR